MISRIDLAHLPTPIEPMPNLSALLQGPQLYVKRDDQTGLAFGGNKTRKLEFLVADALDHKAKMLISAGAVQSNHCRQVAAAAAKLGLKCKLVLFGEQPETAEGNFLLYQLFDAEVILTDREHRDSTLQKVFDDAQVDGEKPYLIPYGGSNPIGAIAYAYAFDEMLLQNFIPDWIVIASSSGGTQAGLVL
ncbi:MAG: pyridoxal-phosphate dependent enzyme, partial [Anaerolineaceae bacterium]|nr:pyridoxal-phosphate dependent enzyme [Anaerolineaceae bacterium]